MLYDLLPLQRAHFGALALLLIAALWHRYATKRRHFLAYENLNEGKGAPLTFPYIFPLLGSLPVSYLWNPRAFVLDRK
jgi:hypothetical protein